MPAAQVFGRRFLVGTDDFFLPYGLSALLFVLLAVLWTAVFFHAYADISKYSGFCELQGTVLSTEKALFIDGCILLALFGLVAMVSAACAFVATRGTLLQESKRRLAIPLAVASSALTVALFAPLVLFLVAMNNLYFSEPCATQLFRTLTQQRVLVSNPLWRLQGICIVALTMVASSVLLNILLLQSRRGFSAKVQRSCKAAGFCCGCSESLAETEGGDAPIEEEIANIMSRIFVPLPLVLSDMVAGFILLAAYQGQKREVATPS